jgi:hypothetical protein
MLRLVAPIVAAASASVPLFACSRPEVVRVPEDAAAPHVMSLDAAPWVAETAPPRANYSGTRESVMGAECWYAGSSCEGRGAAQGGFELRGSTVTGGTVHGGCNVSTYALVYEPKTSPLRLRVCASAPPPVDCPAMVRDFAAWDVAPLLAANGAVRAVLMGASPD